MSRACMALFICMAPIWIVSPALAQRVVHDDDDAPLATEDDWDIRDDDDQPRQAGRSGPGFFIGINALALLTAVEGVFGKLVMPFLTNMEYGGAINVGYLFSAAHALEIRLAAGLSASRVFVPQIQVGYDFFPLALIGRDDAGLHLGLSLRLWDNYFLDTEVHYANLSTELVVGYWWQLPAGFFVDLRLSWPFAVISWSSQEHSSAAASFVLFPPSLGLNVGYRF